MFRFELIPLPRMERSSLPGFSSFEQSLVCEARAAPDRRTAHFFALVLFLTRFLAAAFAGQCFFYPLPLAGLEVKRVTLYFLDNVFGLYLPLESSQRIFERFTLLKSNFRQLAAPPHSS
jgi:hypothetical protein